MQMPKERTRRKKKAKEWYSVIAPPLFGKVKIAETPSDDPEKLIGRNVSISLQELTNDFSKSHIKLQFKIVNVKGLEANTIFIGHAFTSDYIKRMSRRHKSKIDGVFDVVTKDGMRLRIKPSALAGKRILTSQKREIRAVMKNEIEKEAGARNFDDFVKYMLDGELGKSIHRASKKVYPVRRIEIWKSHLLEIPHVEVKVEKAEEITEEVSEEVPEKAEEITEEVSEETPEEIKEESES
ncbi:30S ribosomal protein S3ae [Thermoplasmatales archaeon ex4484_30]|nr:MAG: 30S ribosomal protein S3ae [Thermoplasmatales archaeon ex4484_30]